ncbi:hypothetical protein E5288_WYG018505 [Bos mutus]|uniref:KRAB domain-containing protein n=1 Tax=Bos mutus TaxID=72004 RepID=A0A6B0RV59_9CETA|nr:hypothetical protein [Bos mutus]
MAAPTAVVELPHRTPGSGSQSPSGRRVLPLPPSGLRQRGGDAPAAAPLKAAALRPRVRPRLGAPAAARRELSWTPLILRDEGGGCGATGPQPGPVRPHGAAGSASASFSLPQLCPPRYVLSRPYPEPCRSLGLLKIPFMPNGYVDHSSAAKQGLIIPPTLREKALGSTLECPYTLVFILLFHDFAEIVSKFHSYFSEMGMPGINLGLNMSKPDVVSLLEQGKEPWLGNGDVSRELFPASKSNGEIKEFSPKNVIFEDDSSQYLIMERFLSQGSEYSSFKEGWKCEGDTEMLQGNQGCIRQVTASHQEALSQHVNEISGRLSISKPNVVSLLEQGRMKNDGKNGNRPMLSSNLFDKETIVTYSVTISIHVKG